MKTFVLEQSFDHVKTHQIKKFVKKIKETFDYISAFEEIENHCLLLFEQMSPQLISGTETTQTKSLGLITLIGTRRHNWFNFDFQIDKSSLSSKKKITLSLKRKIISPDSNCVWIEG